MRSEEDYNNKGVKNKCIKRRSFITGATTAIVAVNLGSNANCQQSQPAVRSGNPDIAQRADALISGLVAEDRFSGAALVARHGTPVFRKAYGLASREFNFANRVDTKFNVASMGKMFTGVAIAQLAQQGRLTFNDSINRHLPDYPREVGNQVTIHHLLTHTSGMGSYWKDEFHEANHARYRTVQDYFPLFINDPLAFRPGERWSYSNAGFMVLGAIIERVSGQTYFDYVKENVFGRAGMNNTDFYEADKPTPNLAIGYTKQNRYLRGERDWTNNIFISPVKGGPAGGGYSTIDDMLRFDIALRTHRLLDRQHTDTVLTGKIEYRANASYAYGFANEIVNGQRIIFHDGGANGISAELDMYPNTGYTIVVLSNYDHPAARPVVRGLREIVTTNPA